MSWEDLTAEVEAEFAYWHSVSEEDHFKAETIRRALAKESHRASSTSYYRRHRSEVLERNRRRREKNAKPRTIKTHCCHGHLFDEKNTRVDERGRRFCRACDRARHAKKPRALKTHCPQGHAYDDKNTYVDGKGVRKCRECDRVRSQDRRRRLVAS